MKKLLDINTWIALTLEQHPHHSAARKWHEEGDLSPGDLVFCLPTEIGFLRLITQKAVMNRCGVEPLSNFQAIEYLGTLLAAPVVSRVDEPTGVHSLWLQLADTGVCIKRGCAAQSIFPIVNQDLRRS